MSTVTECVHGVGLNSSCQQCATTSAMGCPHGRRAPGMCPHCLGLNRLSPVNRVAPGQQLLEYQRRLAVSLDRKAAK